MRHTPAGSRTPVTGWKSVAFAVITMGAVTACAEAVIAPVAPSPTTFRLAAKNGIAIAQAADVACDGVLGGALRFVGSGDGWRGYVVVSHLVRSRLGDTITVVDTAAFQQVGRALDLRFPAPATADGSTAGVTASFVILDDGSLELRSQACVPGDIGVRDMLKILRYARAG